MIIMQVSTCKYGIYHTIAYLCCQYFFHFFIFGSNIKDAIYPKIKAADIPTALALNPPIKIR